mmetsp:Transcript_15898/g.23043  ORF Transcript_15898/g.23043 Transcript_15898/m.23043 type:complete len:378 (+) Transcript_15898:11-1144(+)
MSSWKVNMNVWVYNMESTSLFNYESFPNNPEKVSIKHNAQILSDDQKIQVDPTNEIPRNVLFKVNCNKEECLILPGKGLNMWTNARFSNEVEKTLELQEGDIFRLGAVQLRVKELNSQGCPETAKGIPEPKSGRSLGEEFCRICLSTAFSDENPLVSPCSCTGSMKLIHVSCLQYWVSSRLKVTQRNFVCSYYWTSLNCELCGEKFTLKHSLGGTIVDLTEVYKPDLPYMVVEDLRNDCQGGYLVHVLTGNSNEEIKAGKGENSDLLVKDQSVCDHNSNIAFKNGRFYLKDNNSKFGSLLYVKKVLLHKGDSVLYQVKNCLVEAKFEEKSNCLASLFKACCVSGSKKSNQEGNQLKSSELSFEYEEMNPQREVSEEL